MEPFLPKPLLVLVGHGPVVDTLAALGRATDFAVTVLASEALGSELARLPLGPHASVVVATHGNADEDALERVLEAGVSYVSLIASRKRAATVHEDPSATSARGTVSARLKAPAGLEIGAVTPEEIAVSNPRRNRADPTRRQAQRCRRKTCSGSRRRPCRARTRSAGCSWTSRPPAIAPRPGAARSTSVAPAARTPSSATPASTPRGSPRSPDRPAIRAVAHDAHRDRRDRPRGRTLSTDGAGQVAAPAQRSPRHSDQRGERSSRRC